MKGAFFNGLRLVEFYWRRRPFGGFPDDSREFCDQYLGGDTNDVAVIVRGPPVNSWSSMQSIA